MGTTTPRDHLGGAPRKVPSIKVLIAEDVDVVRDTLVALLELEDDLEVVAAPASGDHIMPIVQAARVRELTIRTGRRPRSPR
ncbi:hypothetical protein [Streptosporangium sandarakinum]|uniref:hypothetical protein n=1 Tax=Streptosporangium sandarakinum TaxID=1260955 RepID=UPI003418FEAE